MPAQKILAGRYELGALIGRGGMADVYAGTDSRLGRRVAIKLLKPSLATDPKFRMLFREEAQKAARMAHPTIVRVFDAGEETVSDATGIETQVPFIVMEYVDGRLLKEIIAEGPLDSAEAIRIIDGVLTALEYSHRALLVHRDIKPGNIMITHNGQVKVMDFGIARAVSDNSTTVADTSAILGTAQYFSPEQARGETVDARTDLYSTGVVLFELLTGRPPFRGERPAAVAYQHISENAVAPSTLNPQVSPALDAVVLHALRKDKFQRFQSAAEFREDLASAGRGETPTRASAAGTSAETVMFGASSRPSTHTDATLRQLAPVASPTSISTPNRPPVAWIWVGVIALIAVLVGLALWVMQLTAPDISDKLSVVVPEVAGEPYDSGEATLSKLGLETSRMDVENDDVEAGLIVSTDPPAGSRVAPEQQVRILVSKGPRTVAVPQLANLSTEAAIEALQAAGLTHGQTREENHPSLGEGTVIGSDPDFGANAKAGDAITLITSTGNVGIPNVKGQSIGAATEALSRLELNVVPQPDFACAGESVTGQSLAPGDYPQRSEISLTYCAAATAPPPVVDEDSD